MFDDFKAAHGGLGPVQSLFDTASRGYLTNKLRHQAVSGQMDDTLASIKQDPELTDEFKSHAGELLRHGVYDMDTAVKHIDGLTAEVGTQKSISRAFGPILDSAQSLFDNAQTPEAKSLASDLLKKTQAAHELVLNPATRDEGMKLFGTAANDVTAANVTNQANKVAQNVRDADAARLLTDHQQSVYQNTRENWQKDSVPFQITQNAWRGVQDIAGLQVHTAQTDQLLARQVATIMNPGIAARPGEDPGDAYYNALPEGVGQAVKFVLTKGSMFTDEERGALVASALQRVQQENAAQVDRNTRALNEGKAEELPQKFLDQLTVPLIDLGALANYREPGPTPAQNQTTGNLAKPDPHPETSTPDTTAQMVGESLKEGVKSAIVSGAEVLDSATGGFGAAAVRKLKADKGKYPGRQAPSAPLPQDDFTTSAGGAQ